MANNATKIILVRHGESLGNHDKKFLGHFDLDLSQLGYKQAELVGKHFKDIIVDAIYSSDLKRAYNTVLPVSKCKNIPIITSKNLREIYAGSWESLTFSDISVKYADDYSVWVNDIGFARCTDGESVLELQDRIYREIVSICDQNKNKVICIGTHATSIRTFIAKCLDKNTEEIKDIPWYHNASLTTLEYIDGKFHLIESNFCEHLNGLNSSLPPNA